MGILLLSTTLRWSKSEVDETVCGTDADYSFRIRYEHMYPEESEEQTVHRSRRQTQVMSREYSCILDGIR